MTGLRGVALGGAAGASLRTGVVLLVGLAPGLGAALLAVAAVNLSGTALLGWVAGRAAVDARWAARADAVGGGLAGALTTFSGLSLQLALLADRIGWGWTALAAVAQVATGLVVLRVARRTGERGLR